jgi:tetratricopeptide (TPR) repeat protein
MGETRTAKVGRLVREGLDHFGEGDVAGALRCWEEVLRIDPGHAEALDYLEAARGEPDPLDGAAAPGAADAPAPVREPEAAPSERLVEEARARFEREDLEGALDLFRAAAELEPERIEMEGWIDMLRSRLLQRYRKHLGPMEARPKLLIQPAAITRYPLPKDAGFVLSMVDGETSIEDLVALSGMDAFEAMRILNHLLDAGIVGLGP